MICPHCGARTWDVVRSVHADSAPKLLRNHGGMLKRAAKLVGDYTQDFIVRQRTCSTCSRSDSFLELPMADLEAVIKLRAAELLAIELGKV